MSRQSYPSTEHEFLTHSLFKKSQNPFSLTLLKSSEADNHFREFRVVAVEVRNWDLKGRGEPSEGAQIRLVLATFVLIDPWAGGKRIDTRQYAKLLL